MILVAFLAGSVVVGIGYCECFDFVGITGQAGASAAGAVGVGYGAVTDVNLLDAGGTFGGRLMGGW